MIGIEFQDSGPMGSRLLLQLVLAAPAGQRELAIDGFRAFLSRFPVFDKRFILGGPGRKLVPPQPLPPSQVVDETDLPPGGLAAGSLLSCRLEHRPSVVDSFPRLALERLLDELGSGPGFFGFRGGCGRQATDRNRNENRRANSPCGT